MRTVLLLGFMTLLLAASVLVGRQLGVRVESRRYATNELVYLPPAWLMRTASLGRRTAVADYYWTQALQYYGDGRNRRVQYRDLHRFFDLIIALDPDFEYAYAFGGSVIPFNTGRWTWHNVEASTQILEKGTVRFPDNWQMWMQLGFNRGTLGENYAGAADAYARAAATPGAPPWLAELVSRLYVTAGAFERAKTYSEEMAKHADSSEMREAMARRLEELELEQTLVRLDGAMESFKQEFGREPVGLWELVAKGHLETLPADPLGGDFYIEQGEVRSTSIYGGRLRVFDDRAGHRK